MEMQRRNQLRIVNGDDDKLRKRPARVDSLDSKKDDRTRWSDEMLSEISRVHALVDMVNGELSRMFSDDSMHALKVIEKNTELRELQAYYKGLRFAVDLQKEIAADRLMVTIELD